jgi:cold shock CspA family protein
MIGRVTFFDVRKGWGFIRTADGDEYFVHRIDILDKRPLERYEDVEFQLGSYNKRVTAVQVQRIPVEPPKEARRD